MKSVNLLKTLNRLDLLVIQIELGQILDCLGSSKVVEIWYTEYSKEMIKPGNLYLHLVSNKLYVGNEFERNFRLLKASEVPIGRLIDWIRKDIRDPEGADKGFKDTIKNYDNMIKEFLNSSLNQKLKKSPIIHYKYLFSQCELERKETPRTFDARWEKADIKYLGDKIK